MLSIMGLLDLDLFLNGLVLSIEDLPSFDYFRIFYVLIDPPIAGLLLDDFLNLGITLYFYVP